MKLPTRYKCDALFKGFLVVPFFMVVSAGAQTCDISHLALEYGGQACLDKACSTIHQKWQFVGTRILQYPDPSQEVGIAWQLGKTVDMMSDAANLRFEPTAKGDQKESATLTAKQIGSDFVLTRHNQITTANGQILGDQWFRIAIQISNCERCNLLVYDISGDSKGYPSKVTFGGNWCRVLN